jgi:hypothetical protein
MPTPTNPIERAKKRYKEVEDIMARADEVRDEYLQLRSFLMQAYQLFPDAFDEPPVPVSGVRPTATATSPPATPTTPAGPVGWKPPKPPGKLRTSDFAAWVLTVHGRLHIREILKRMLEEGWSGNPDGKKAEKTLFNTMASHKNRFRNVGNNFWELIGEVVEGKK